MAARRLLVVLMICLVPVYQCASMRRDDVITQQDAEYQSQEQRWLDDYDTALRPDSDSLYDVMLADSPASSSDTAPTTGRDVIARVQTLAAAAVSPPTDDDDDDEAPRCPPPILPAAMIASWCSAAAASGIDRCQSDGDCSLQTLMTSSSNNRKRKCCFNGCRRVCAVPVDPAPYIDWKREPQTRLTSGKSWLISGPEIATEVEWCSTSYVYDDVTSDEEPLLCPTGYTCYIDDPGDVTNGIPNRGRCVLESTFSDTASKFHLVTSGETNNGSCNVLNVIYNSGDIFTYEKRTCQCEDGSVLCRVGKKTTIDVVAAKRRV